MQTHPFIHPLIGMYYSVVRDTSTSTVKLQWTKAFREFYLFVPLVQTSTLENEENTRWLEIRGWCIDVHDDIIFVLQLVCYHSFVVN